MLKILLLHFEKDLYHCVVHVVHWMCAIDIRLAKKVVYRSYITFVIYVGAEEQLSRISQTAHFRCLGNAWMYLTEAEKWHLYNCSVNIKVFAL